MKPKAIVLVLVILVALLAACASPQAAVPRPATAPTAPAAAPQSVNVFAAASLTEALAEIGQRLGYD